MKVEATLGNGVLSVRSVMSRVTVRLDTVTTAEMRREPIRGMTLRITATAAYTACRDGST